MVNVKDLEFFQSLAATRSFTQTARDCKVSQPSVSTAIQRLEKQLGTTLFDRTRFHGQVQLTGPGQRFRGHVDTILAELNLAIEEIDNDEAGRVIRFGLPPIIGRFYFASVIAQLADAHLFSSVSISEYGSDSLLRELSGNTIDMGLIGSLDDDFISPQLTTELLASFPFRIFVSQKHRLAQRTTVSMDDIAGERFVSLADGFVHKRVLVDLFEAAGAKLNLAAETDQIDTFRTLITANVGIGLSATLGMRPNGGGEGGDGGLSGAGDGSDGSEGSDGSGLIGDGDLASAGAEGGGDLVELELLVPGDLPRFNIFLFHAKSKFLSAAELRVIKILRGDRANSDRAAVPGPAASGPAV